MDEDRATFNWCTTTNSGEYSVCAVDEEDAAPPLATPSNVQSNNNPFNNMPSGDGDSLPGWGIALIVLFCLAALALGYIVLFAKKDKVGERNIYTDDAHSGRWSFTEGKGQKSSADSRTKIYNTDRNSYDIRSKASESIAHASYGSRQVKNTRASRDPTMYVPEGEKTRVSRDPTMYVPGQEDKPDPASRSKDIVEELDEISVASPWQNVNKRDPSFHNPYVASSGSGKRDPSFHESSVAASKSKQSSVASKQSKRDEEGVVDP